MKPLNLVQKHLIDNNGMVRRPDIPFDRLTVKDKQAYLRQKFNLTHGKGKSKQARKKK